MFIVNRYFGVLYDFGHRKLLYSETLFFCFLLVLSLCTAEQRGYQVPGPLFRPIRLRSVTARLSHPTNAADELCSGSHPPCFGHGRITAENPRERLVS